jgi:hypothetical protein
MDLESGITYKEMTSYTDLEPKELDSSMNNQFCPDEKSTVYEEGENKDDNS